MTEHVFYHERVFGVKPQRRHNIRAIHIRGLRHPVVGDRLVRMGEDLGVGLHIDDRGRITLT